MKIKSEIVSILVKQFRLNFDEGILHKDWCLKIFLVSAYFDSY